MTINKSLLTNLIAASLVIAGFYAPIPYSHIILSTGLFALSGGITNWLAIHMLFEKIPLIYGSGVIPNQFESFKAGIKHLIIEEFFNQEHIERFFQQHTPIKADALTKKIDFDHIYQGIVQAIIESPFGGMLNMLGGTKALEPLKEPIIKKLKDIIQDLTENTLNNSDDNDITKGLINKVEQIIDNRLKELTPQKVKSIIQSMIHKHLGWLVVWGGVFGGAIGLLISIINN